MLIHIHTDDVLKAGKLLSKCIKYQANKLKYKLQGVSEINCNNSRVLFGIAFFTETALPLASTENSCGKIMASKLHNTYLVTEWE